VRPQHQRLVHPLRELPQRSPIQEHLRHNRIQLRQGLSPHPLLSNLEFPVRPEPRPPLNRSHPAPRAP
jgi:hypothetical protein